MDTLLTDITHIINTESKFNNRLREEGWLTPTATQLLRTHIELFKKVSEILPVSDAALEINKFAFMQLDNPDMKKWNIDFQHGPLYGKGGVKSAVHELQNGICLLCGKRKIEDYHHIIPRSKRGSDTVENYAGLCERCHEKVHKSQEAADRLAAKKAGLTKKYDRKNFIFYRSWSLLTEEVEEVADEFTDNADEEDLRVVQIYENYEELGKDYMDKVVGIIDHHVLAVLDLEELGKHLADTCEEYLVCESSGRVIQFEL